MARLRLVGRLPTGHQAGMRERRGGKNAPCGGSDSGVSGAAAAGEDENDASDPQHIEQCGWAYATPCSGNESACGLDALGYFSDEELRIEMAQWNLMIAPIFATTGANTKILLGLQAGLPIVATRAAAAPFGIAPDAAGAGPAAAWVVVA